MESFLFLSTIICVGLVFVWQRLSRHLPSLWFDVMYLKALIKTMFLANNLKRNLTTPNEYLEVQARKMPNKAYVLYEDISITYKRMNSWVNQYAHALTALGLGHGSKVGILMMNEPAFLATWFAANRIGAVAVFLNCNLKAKQLLHCIKLAEVKMLIVGDEPTLHELASDVSSFISDNNELNLYNYGPSNFQLKSIADLVEKESIEPFKGNWKTKENYFDPVCYIFTSGTTGLPKAVKITNVKYWLYAHLSPVEKDDIVYPPMPLFHTAAIGLSALGGLLNGSTIVLTRKFSASKFWDTCRKYDVNKAQYIGEIARYICLQPPSPKDKVHKVTSFFGNGIRSDIWKLFLSRFGENIKVVEMYGATEGNVGLINITGEVGCLGFFGPIMRTIGPYALIKYDVAENEIVRDKNGRAILTGPMEPGLLIGKISKYIPLSSYKGNDKAMEKKKLRNLFKKGDEYFNTGDMMMLDEKYRLHFCDRVGDTFRWKGENVSTNEVSDILVQARGVKEANVYGVNIPGCEGRAGMVSLILDDSTKFDGIYLYTYVCNNLSSYARPMFIRIQEKLELTGSFKQTKFNLQKEGFDLEQVKNEMYFLDILGKSYVPFTKEIQQKINNEELKL